MTENTPEPEETDEAQEPSTLIVRRDENGEILIDGDGSREEIESIAQRIGTGNYYHRPAQEVEEVEVEEEEE